MNTENQAFIAQNLEFYPHLSPDQQQLVLQNLQTITARKGDVIYSSTQECLGVVLVKAGALRVYILSDDGKEVTIMRTQTAEVCILSASCVVQQINFDVHVEATSDCELLVVPAFIFARLMAENMQVELLTLRLMADKFSEVMWTMEQILFLPIEARLAIFLLDEIARTDSIAIPLTHEQIAKYIGSAREVVTRELRQLAKQNIVQLHRGTVEIVDKSALRARSSRGSRLS